MGLKKIESIPLKTPLKTSQIRFEMETSVFYDDENGAGIGVWGGFRF